MCIFIYLRIILYVLCIWDRWWWKVRSALYILSKYIILMLYFCFIQERLERIMPAMARLLAEWTEMFPYDFRDEGMTSTVRGMTQGFECVPSLVADVGKLLQTLLTRLNRLELFENQLASWDAEGITDRRELLLAVGLWRASLQTIK